MGRHEKHTFPQDVDRVNRLPDTEKPCKTRKHGLQMRAHTRTYVTDFAVRVDDASRNFSSIKSCSRNFCGCGVCQWSEEGMVLPCLPLSHFRLMLPQRCGYTARAVRSFLRSHRTHRSCRTGDSAPSGSARMPSVRNSPARSPSRRARRPSGA